MYMCMCVHCMYVRCMCVGWGGGGGWVSVVGVRAVSIEPEKVGHDFHGMCI